MAEYNSPSSTVSHAISNSFELLFHDDLNRNHSRRLQAYRKYWLFYLGKHWSYVRDPGEPTITVNYCRRMVDLHVDFAFKGGFKSVIPDDPATKENETDDREFIRLMLEETWRKNSRDLWMLEAGQQGAVTGDLFARVSWDVSNPLEDPFARVDIMPSHLCFPEFGGPHGVDRKKLKRLLIVLPVFKESPGAPVSGAFFSRRTKSQSAIELKIMTEEWTSAIVDKKGKITSPAMVYYREDNQLTEEKINPIGEIPVIHVPNYPLSGEYYGISDLVDSVELNREYNEKMTDISDIINYHASPQTIITGAKLSTLEKGANRMWGLPEGAEAKNLELESDLGAATKHLNTIKESILELTGTPEQVLGTKMNISNTTGVALQIQYLPMLERRNIKVLTYGLGLRLINRLIMKVTEIGNSGFGDEMKKVKRNKYRNDVVFGDPMPQDERRDLEISREKLDLGFTTRARELLKRGVSQAEIDRLLEQVEAEQLKQAEMIFQTPGPGSGNATFNKGGAGDTLGDKIGNTLAKKE